MRDVRRQMFRVSIVTRSQHKGAELRLLYAFAEFERSDVDLAQKLRAAA
jgi:hypothetical protein